MHSLQVQVLCKHKRKYTGDSYRPLCYVAYEVTHAARKSVNNIQS